MKTHQVVVCVICFVSFWNGPAFAGGKIFYGGLALTAGLLLALAFLGVNVLKEILVELRKLTPKTRTEELKDISDRQSTKVTRI